MHLIAQTSYVKPATYITSFGTSSTAGSNNSQSPILIVLLQEESPVYYVVSRSVKPLTTTGIESLRSPMPLDNHYTFNIMNPVEHLCRVMNYTIALTELLTKALTSEDNLSTENSTPSPMTKALQCRTLLSTQVLAIAADISRSNI